MSQSEVATSSSSATAATWHDDILAFTDDTRPLFLSDHETARCYDVQASLSRMDEGRRKELDTAREQLRTLARQAEAYKLSAQRPASAASAKQHESKLVDLDTQKYGLAKTIADLEQATSSAEASLAKCKEHAANLDKQDPVGNLQSGNVADALKLAIIRSMGFVPIEDRGQYTALLVKSDTSNDVHSLSTIDATSSSTSSTARFELVQKAWQLVR